VVGEVGDLSMHGFLGKTGTLVGEIGEVGDPGMETVLKKSPGGSRNRFHWKITDCTD